MPIVRPQNHLVELFGLQKPAAVMQCCRLRKLLKPIGGDGCHARLITYCTRIWIEISILEVAGSRLRAIVQGMFLFARWSESMRHFAKAL
jgi:hypothetical protein